MRRNSHHQVMLIEMACAIRAEHPDVDWHEAEPMFRALWDHARRSTAWDDVREDAAMHWRFGATSPPSAVILEVGTAGDRSLRAGEAGS